LAVGWSQRARTDLGAIFSHIAADDRGAAERWIGRILEHTDLAAEADLLEYVRTEPSIEVAESSYAVHWDKTPKAIKDEIKRLERMKRELTEPESEALYQESLAYFSANVFAPKTEGSWLD
jgi:hypothetical protein